MLSRTLTILIEIERWSPYTHTSNMLQRPNESKLATQTLSCEFIVTAQNTQEQSGKKLVGNLNITPDSFSHLSQYLASSAQVRGYTAEVPGISAALETLLGRFEIMCQRRLIALPALPFREHIYAQLCKSLYENTKFFSCPPKLLISPTLFSPIPLIDAFSSEPLNWFQENQPGIVLKTFSSNPANPVKYLHKTLERIQSIKTYLEQQEKKLPASIQLKVALGSHHKKPEDSVRDHLAVVDKICTEPEFSEFYRNKIYAVVHAVGNYGENGARAFLRKAQGICLEILADYNFASLHESLGTIMFATIHNPDHTTEFLTSMLAREQRILEMMKQLNRTIGKKPLRDLCLKTPLRAKQFEMRLTEELALLG